MSKKKRPKSSKGSDFERGICHRLSRWWTGDRDDVFWRTSGSGARASARRNRSGTATAGSAGDITAIDPIGQPLLQVCSLELKRGYSKHTWADLLDRSTNAAQQQWEGWIEQASRDARNAGSLYWMIITRRDYREAFVIIPDAFNQALRAQGCLHEWNVPSVQLLVTVRDASRKPLFSDRLFGTSLDNFLEEVSPDDIRAILEEQTGGRNERGKSTA